MKTILAILCFVLLPTVASAGLLFGDRVTIHNYGGSSTGTYGYSGSYSYVPRIRTYRIYSAPVVTYQIAPVQAYAAPVAVVPAPQAAPTTADSTPVQQYGVPVTTYQTTRSYVATNSLDTITSVKHKETHKHGRHKVSHVEKSRD